MKPNPIPLIAGLFLFAHTISAQQDSRYQLQLKSGAFIPEKNITAEKLDLFNHIAYRASGKTFAIIQFEQLPSTSERNQLEKSGIELLDYIPTNAYTVTIHGLLNSELLIRMKVRAVVEMTADQKMQPELAKGNIPGWASTIAGTADLWISYPKSYEYDEVERELQNRNFEITSNSYKEYRVIAVRTAVQRIRELASLPFIEYVEPAPHPTQVLNNRSTANSRAHVLQSFLAGERQLRGEGVVVGVGDDADPLRHVDFTGRLINRAAIAGGSHGVHVTGIVGGAGINYEIFTGAAPKCTIVAQESSRIIFFAPAYVQDYGMVITNNSYGNVINDCSTFGAYTLISRIVDQQAFILPELQHVFATGNSAVFNCSPYPNGFGTVLGDFQASKNILDVGNTAADGVIDGFSSRGPVKDGRIKPEICAQGGLVGSTWPVNTYNFDTGTSMAAPAVSGGLALLIQRYRQLHGNANPKNGLIKALACNGATDLGKRGPDYTFGFGWLNLLRSVKMIENNSYLTDVVANGNLNTYPITVAPNTAKLKVMLYWNDPAASVLASHTLVNDLDLEVIDPGSLTILPLTLDTLPANVNDSAQRRVDHINNIEQVVIDAPVAGSYTIRVKGTAITQGPQQEYFVVIDTIPVSLTLVHPMGGERFNPGLQVYISWDSYGDSTHTFTIEYSTDNGTSWNMVNNNIAPDVRLLLWTVPSTITEQGLIKITQNGTGVVKTSQPFIVIDLPTPSLAAVQCEDYFGLKWTKVTGATDYEVMMLRGDEMVSVGTTIDSNYVIGGLSKDSVYWASVRPRLNGVPGRRSIALSRQPNSGTCAGIISDNDIKLNAILSPARSGRRYTSTSLSATTSLTVQIKNLDDVATTQDIVVSYSLNGGSFIPETILNPAIPAGTSISHTFSGTIDMSAVGIYNIRVAISQTGDANSHNDTLEKTFKQLDNAPLTGITTPWVDNIETATDQTILNAQVGLDGLDRYDFVNSTANGRLRTFINTGIAYSGSKALTLDADRFIVGNTDSLTGTFNLSGYDTATDDIRFDFQYKNHNQANNAANRVWIRGNDQSSWILVYNLFANQPDPGGTYKLISGIELQDSLAVHLQNYSSSFQVRWGQWGRILASDDYGGAGYTFDDIRLYKVSNDVQMVSIDAPIAASCALGINSQVSVTVKNSVNATISAVPIVLKVDGIVIATETLPPIPGNSSISYTFNPATANLSAFGSHVIQVWVDLPSDTYRQNDTATVTITNVPKIVVGPSTPYLQNFETDNGSFYATGYNSSWEYGTPASTRINRAASGSKAWKTRLVGNYNDLEYSYLYSPCFNISGLTNPTLSFSVALDLEDCGGTLCDAAFIEYSADGVNWLKLGANGQGTNWYNKAYTGNHVWSVQNYQRWHVATIPLPNSGLTELRLRFVMSSDMGVSRDGIAVDDIHIYDNSFGIYTGPTMGSPVMMNIPGGSTWVNFTTGGKLIASVKSPTVSMGDTYAQAYINTGAVRFVNGQYYHNRDITIKPETSSLADSATVRFYFLDTETELLINATGCPTCLKPSMAYELGVSKYNNTNDTYEDGDLSNNTGGNWKFVHPDNAVKVPFDKGYYVEYKVKDFSEFWLNNGGTGFQPLPVQLLDFTAKKKDGTDVSVEWLTSAETNVDHYEVELAKGNNEYQRNRFVRIGQVNSQGNTNHETAYSFIDTENDKSGVRFYRLKIVNSDGSFTYSSVRAVMFSDELSWQVYPNPSGGIFNLIYQANNGSPFSVKVYGVTGSIVKQYNPQTTGFVQKLVIDLQESAFASGVYLVEVKSGQKQQVFRLIKN